MSLLAGKQARVIESAWRDGGPNEQLATEPSLLRFIAQHPTDPQCAGMRLRLAWLRLSQRRLNEAVTLVEPLRPVASGVEADWVTLLDGAILRQQGQSAKALDCLLRLEGKIVDVTLRELWSVEAVKAALEVQRFETAVELMVGLRANGSDEHLVTTQTQIESWLIRLPEDALSRQLTELTRKAARPVADEGMRQARGFMLETIRNQLARAALARRDTTLARQLLNSASPRFKRSEVGEELRRLSDLAEPPVQSLQAAVGVLLEMQDDFASRRSVEIITGAMRALDENPSTLPVRLISREIRETTDAAIEAGLLALVQDGAAIIVAGVTPATAKAAVRLAVARQAVVITLSGEPSGEAESNHLFRVEDVTGVVERTFAKTEQGGPLRLTMKDAFCASPQPAENRPFVFATGREILLLTDEDCARKAANEIATVKTGIKIWLGPEAVAAADRFSEVSLVTSPSLAAAAPTSSIQHWQVRFHRMPFWYEALGYDVVHLSSLTLSATATQTVTGADRIAHERDRIAAALGRAQAALLTSSASGFDPKQRLVPTLVTVAAKPIVKERSGP